MPEAEDNRTDSVAALFRELFELSASERTEVYRRRNVSGEVRDEIEALLHEPSHAAFAEDRLGSAGRSLSRPDQRAVWPPGTRVGDYEIVREIARGGMGVVFEARQRSLARPVAIKVIRDSQFSGPCETQRFRAEAEAIARLEHTGIVPVHEVGEHEGLQFYSMAFYPRGSLHDLELPLRPIAAAELVAQICDAIHYAHTQNIVHRDLKPANVLLTDNLQPRVSDFGLAKDIGNEGTALTRTGALLGTPGFMAPEHAGDQPEPAGHLADVYGLGAILFFVLTGEPPIQGRTLIDTLHKVVHEDARDVRRHRPGIPADLASICRMALEKAPSRRYGSAAAMAADLRRFLQGEPTEARPLGPGRRLVRWCRRRPTLAALSALAVLGIVGGGTSTLLYALEVDQQATELAETNRELTRRNAEVDEARGDAEAFGAFLLDDIVRTARTADRGGIGTEVSVRDALLASIPQIERRFANRPLAEAKARHEIGITLQHVGEREASLEQLQLACEIRERELGTTDEVTLESWHSLATACLAAERFDEAIDRFEWLLEVADVQQRSRITRVREQLACSYERVGRYRDAHALLLRALDHASDPERIRLRSLLAIAQARLHRADAARETLAELDRARDLRERLALRDREFVDHNRFRGYLLVDDVDAATRTGMDLLLRSRRLHGRTHPITVNVARQLSSLGDVVVPFRVMIEALQTLIRFYGNGESQRSRRQAARAARLCLREGKTDRARSFAVLAHTHWYAEDASHPMTFASEALLCEVLLASGERDEAQARLTLRIGPLRERLRATDTSDERFAAYREALHQFEHLLTRL